MLRKENSSAVTLTVEVTRVDLLEQIVAEQEQNNSTKTAGEPKAEPEAIVVVEVQLIQWTKILVPCPGCGVYPCRPGQLNGHHERWVPVAGEVVMVRVDR